MSDSVLVQQTTIQAVEIQAPRLGLTVSDITPLTLELVVPAQPLTVGLITPGPMGPAGPQGPAGVAALSAMQDVDVAGRVNHSVLYYDAASERWKGDDANTIVSMTDGGNF